MQRQHQRLPLFKPVMINDRSQQVTDSNLSRLRPSEPFQKMSQQHHEEHEMVLGTDRLTSLHAKLHQEADKIRKWKTQTELDMKQKEKKLSEATMTIESLRKSILELQLENENLSTKLQDELVSKEEVFQRIHSTRELINLLKHQEEKLEDRLSKCEAERTELKNLENEHAHQFEDMCEKFKKMEFETTEVREHLIQQVHAEQAQREKMEKDMQSKLSLTESEILSLKCQIQERSAALEEARIAIQNKSEMIEAANNQLDKAQQQVCQLSQEISSKQETLQQLGADISNLQSERDSLASELLEEREKLEQSKRQEDSVQEALNNSVAIFNQRHDCMQKEMDILKYELAEEQKRLREARAQLAESIAFADSLKSSRDVLLLEKKEVELCLEKLKTELTDLQNEKYKNKAEISSLEAEVESLQQHIEEERQETVKAQGELREAKLKSASLEKKKHALIEEAEKLTNAITAQKRQLEALNAAHVEEKKHLCELQLSAEGLTTQLQEKGLQKAQLEVKLKTSEDILSAKEKQLAEAESRIINLQMELKTITEERDSAKACMENLEKTAEEWRKESECAEGRRADIVLRNELLMKETEKRDQTVAAELQGHIEKNEQLQKQIKELRAELKEKNKHIKDVEKEVKALHFRIAKQEKAEEETKREVEYLKQELVCNEQAKEEGENLVAKLQNQLEQQKHAVQKQAQQVEELKAETAKAQKEKAAAMLQCDQQIVEMTATLEKYTQDHHKFLAQKDKEIEELRQRNSSLATQKQNGINGQKETEEMKRKLTTLNCELEQAQKYLKEKEMQVETLKSQLVQQEQIVQEMKQNSISMTPAHHRTDTMDIDERRVVETPCTPAHSVSSAQRGILRGIDSISKRRKVAFISPSVEASENFEVDTDSSTELEVEVEAVMNHGKRNQRTPLRLRHSPAGKRQQTSLFSTFGTPPKPSKPLGKASTAHPRSARNLTPELSPKIKQLARTPNVRKPQMRTSKFFRSSPKERATIKQRDSPKERLSWFDEDVVYRLGPED